MSPTSVRKVVAIAAAAAIIGIAGWLDSVVLVGIQRTAEATFDPTQLTWSQASAYLLAAGAVLLIGLLARWAGSATVGLVYALVGAFLAFLSPIVWTWSASINGADPILPGPIASFVNFVYPVEQGPVNAVAIIAAAMLLVGIASILAAMRGRASAPAGVPNPVGQPGASQG